MKKTWIALFLLLVLGLACRQAKRYHDEADIPVPQKGQEQIAAILQFQEDLNTSFSDAETTPLKNKDRERFQGLNFYAPDTQYIVTARLVRTPQALPFDMPTTTGDKTKERVYGRVQFKLQGQDFELELYQSPSLMQQEGYEDYLFLPFTDETNGEDTYGGGRYLDMRIPQGETLRIDFNRAYNPSCAYNEKYSCPLVPSQNHIPISVRAGVKDYK